MERLRKIRLFNALDAQRDFLEPCGIKVKITKYITDDTPRKLLRSERGGVGKITSVSETNDLLAAAKNAAQSLFERRTVSGTACYRRQLVHG